MIIFRNTVSVSSVFAIEAIASSFCYTNPNVMVYCLFSFCLSL